MILCDCHYDFLSIFLSFPPLSFLCSCVTFDMAIILYCLLLPSSVCFYNYHHTAFISNFRPWLSESFLPSLWLRQLNVNRLWKNSMFWVNPEIMTGSFKLTNITSSKKSLQKKTVLQFVLCMCSFCLPAVLPACGPFTWVVWLPPCHIVSVTNS